MSEKSFEEEYFSQIYLGKYNRRNPSYKWRSYLKEIIKIKKKGHLLDVGCAFGLFLEQASQVYECDGCDISVFALAQARERLPEAVCLYNKSIEQIEGQDVYDIITCFDVIEHILNLEAVWNNLQRLLKPDGCLVITVPVYDGPLGWLVNRLDKDQTHVHRQNRKFWLEEVEKNFSLQFYSGVWRYFFFRQFYLHVLSRRTRGWATAIFIIAQKR